MSLILDALRKLERDRDARAPGILVVGSVPWGETSRARRVALVGIAAAALALAVAVGWFLRPAAAPPGAEPQLPASVPTLAARPAPTPAPASATPPRSWAPQAVLPSASTSEPAASDVPQPSAEPAVERISVAPVAPDAQQPAPAPRPDDLRLTAISRRDGRPVALINDRLVFEGDSFEGVRVIRIGEAEVEVEVRGERRVLRF